MTSGVVASDDPLAHQAYLGENQLQILRKYGTEQAVGDGDVLFVDGDHTYDLIVVLEGFVKVVEGYGKPDSDVIVTYGPNEFVGEMGLLTGQRVFLTGVASGSGRILRIPVEKVRSINPGCPRRPEPAPAGAGGALHAGRPTGWGWPSNGDTSF